MKKFILSIFCLALLFCSCGQDSPQDPDNDNDQITQAEYDNLSKPCTEDNMAVQLPDAILSNFASNEKTALIYSFFQLSNSLRTGLSQQLFPPTTAVKAKVDNINITANTKAWEWKVGEERYVYIIEDGGYKIRYYSPTSLTGSEVVNMERNEDCSRFRYRLYAYKNEGDIMKGDILMSYVFDQAGTAKIINFQGGDKHGEKYKLRSFEDKSGDAIFEYSDGRIEKLYWQTDGSGNYQIIENGSVIDEGTWTL